MRMSGPQRTSTFVTKNGSHNGRHRLAVIGSGYVGLVTGACLADIGNSVVCLDKDAEKIATLQRRELPFFEPNLEEIILRNVRAGRLSFSDDVEAGIREATIIFIAVGTPMRSDESADLSAIFDVAATIARVLNGPKIAVLKSTVPVETGEFFSAIVTESAAEPHRVDVVSNPEFLREGSAVSDFMHPDRVVIGANNARAAATIRDLYAPLNAPVFVTDLRTSELIKYAANAFLATKVSFINEIANICELVGVDVTAVRAAIALDPRIGGSFMSPGIGYGGSCFPKDVLALERFADRKSYQATLLRSVDAINRAQVRRTVDKIKRALGGELAGKNVCMLGLAFKPNTSDVREAPPLRIIESLVRSGAAVAAHDPVAIDNARAELGSSVAFCSNMYEAIEGCDALVLGTEWSQYLGLDFQAVRKLMRGNVVVDGRNFFDSEKIALAGLHYLGVGRSKEPKVPATVERGELGHLGEVPV